MLAAPTIFTLGQRAQGGATRRLRRADEDVLLGRPRAGVPKGRRARPRRHGPRVDVGVPAERAVGGARSEARGTRAAARRLEGAAAAPRRAPRRARRRAHRARPTIRRRIAARRARGRARPVALAVAAEIRRARRAVRLAPARRGLEAHEANRSAPRGRRAGVPYAAAPRPRRVRRRRKRRDLRARHHPRLGVGLSRRRVPPRAGARQAHLARRLERLSPRVGASVHADGAVRRARLRARPAADFRGGRARRAARRVARAHAAAIEGRRPHCRRGRAAPLRSRAGRVVGRLQVRHRSGFSRFVRSRSRAPRRSSP